MRRSCRLFPGVEKFPGERAPRRIIFFHNSTDADPEIAASTKMSGHREGVNPLRPYYIPPTIGEASEPVSSSRPAVFSHGNNATNAKYASKARDIFSDLDYKDYISEPSPSAISTVKNLIDELLWKYTSVLMAQPFEVAKTILQVRSQDDLGGLAKLETPAAVKRTPSNSVYDQVRAIYPGKKISP